MPKRINAKNIRILTENELTKLFEALQKHSCGLAPRLVYETGISLNEALNLHAGNIDPKKQKITITTGKKRTVAYPNHLQKHIEHALFEKGPTEYLFSVRSDSAGKPQRVHDRTIYLLLNKNTELTVPGRTISAILRDNFIIRNLRAGKTPDELLSIMGKKQYKRISFIQSYIEGTMPET